MPTASFRKRKQAAKQGTQPVVKWTGLLALEDCSAYPKSDAVCLVQLRSVVYYRVAQGK